MYGTIYLITNSINDKVYIGQTISPLNTRWKNHLSFARKDYRSSPSKIARAIRKHGEENFSIRAIASADSKETLDWLEAHLIAKFDSIGNGYNLRLGGANGRASDETKQRMSASAKRIGKRPPAATPESQAKATAARHAKYKGKPRPWSVKRERPIRVDGVEYPSVQAAAIALGAEKTTLHRNLRHSPESKRKPKYRCEWLCLPSDTSNLQTA